MLKTSNLEKLREINIKISQIVSKNRRDLLQAPIGSREWRKEVDYLSQRHCSMAMVNLDERSHVELNGELCRDFE